MFEQEPYVVREATEADVRGVAAMVAACWNDWGEAAGDAEAHAPSWCARREDFAHRNGRAYVAVAGESIVGFVAGAGSEDPSCAVIEDLYVARGARRIGIGSRLAAIVEQSALHDGKRFVDAWCDERLVDGARFFDRRGYTTDGRSRAALGAPGSLVRAYRRRV